MRQKGNKTNFLQELQNEMKEHHFVRFDQLIIEYMGYSSELTTKEEVDGRRKAYLTFLHEIKGENVASLPTIRRWFGIHEFREPTREQIFRICLALRTGVETARDFLIKGICEPSFQIADYEEIILMYCLENRKGYGYYNTMVQEYEKNLDFQKEVRHESNTQWLFFQFESVRKYSEQDFLYWMWEKTNIFKGYSMTAQEYLEIFRDKVIEIIRQELKKQLELFLSETSYYAWKKQKRLNGKREDILIRRYMDKNIISDDLRNNIRELVKMVYSENGQNSILLSELFYINESAVTREDVAAGRGSYLVTKKYLSDLFNIPLQNERMLWVRQALHSLEHRDKGDYCPDSIRLLIGEYGRHRTDIKNVGEARKWLEEYRKEHKRRRQIVKRKDLLPLIHYIAQQEYVRENEKKGLAYDPMSAKKYFQTMADAVMIACSMAPLDENYRYDWILMSCFDKEEMYSYVDVLEII